MTIQELGSIGELLGAIGVILTLLYLAAQLRHNTKAMRSATYQTYTGLAMNISDFMADNTDLFIKLNSDQDLDEEDTIKFSMFALKLFYQMEAMYLHHREGTIGEEVFESRMRGFRKAVATNPRWKEVWDGYRDWDLSDSFVEYVEQSIFEAGA